MVVDINVGMVQIQNRPNINLFPSLLRAVPINVT